MHRIFSLFPHLGTGLQNKGTNDGKKRSDQIRTSRRARFHTRTSTSPPRKRPSTPRPPRKRPNTPRSSRHPRASKHSPRSNGCPSISVYTRRFFGHSRVVVQESSYTQPEQKGIQESSYTQPEQKGVRSDAFGGSVGEIDASLPIGTELLRRVDHLLERTTKPSKDDEDDEDNTNRSFRVERRKDGAIDIKGVRRTHTVPPSAQRKYSPSYRYGVASSPPTQRWTHANHRSPHNLFASKAR